MIRRPLTALFALLLAGCATAPPDKDALTPKDLNSHAEQYDGREVIVRGFVVLGTNGRCLYQSNERLDAFGRALYSMKGGDSLAEFDFDSVTMLNAHVILDNSDLFNGRTITVRGRFVRNYMTMDGRVLDLQACGTNAIALDERDTRRVLRELQRSH